MSEAAERLAEVQGHIADAAKRAQRKADEICLIAVSKTHDAPAIRPLIAAGQRHFGENRVQEAAAKWPALRAETPGIMLHLIGQLQSNKAEEAVALFDAIHSVDRSSLVQALAKACAKAGRQPQLFVQVNIGDEKQKGGCATADLPAMLAEAAEAGLTIDGLMAIPPADIEPAPFFALLAELAERHALPLRSMGMSGDYETAVMLGATHVRVGTALFDAIHSVDRSSLVQALAKACAKAGRQPQLFVQVNVGDEEQKGGCAVADLPALLAEAKAAGLTIDGLMAIPPADIEPAPFFALLDELAERHGLPMRSMGMSGDYETAVMLGATHVRVGTALFGVRD